MVAGARRPGARPTRSASRRGVRSLGRGVDQVPGEGRRAGGDAPRRARRRPTAGRRRPPARPPAASDPARPGAVRYGVEAVGGEHGPLGHRRAHLPRVAAQPGRHRAATSAAVPRLAGRPHERRRRPAPPLGSRPSRAAQAEQRPPTGAAGATAGARATGPTLAVKPWRAQPRRVERRPGSAVRRRRSASQPASSSGPSVPGRARARPPPPASGGASPAAATRTGRTVTPVAPPPGVAAGRRGAGGQVLVALLPAGHRPHQVGQPVQVGADLGARPRAASPAPPRPAASTTARPAGPPSGPRRGRPSSRLLPGHHELGRHLEARRRGRRSGPRGPPPSRGHQASSPGDQLVPVAPGPWPPRPSARRAPVRGRTRSSSSSDPGPASARATPRAAWASSTAPLSSIRARPCGTRPP